MHLLAGAVIFGAYAFFALSIAGYARCVSRKRVREQRRAVERLIQRDQAHHSPVFRARGCRSADRRRAAPGSHR